MSLANHHIRAIWLEITTMLVANHRAKVTFQHQRRCQEAFTGLASVLHIVWRRKEAIKMKKAALAMILFAGSMLAGPRIAAGIGFGVPPVAVVRPVCPGFGYVWVDGYYAPTGLWVAGFWRAPAIGVAVGPR